MGAITGGLAIARFGSKPSMLTMSGRGDRRSPRHCAPCTISATSPTLPIIGLLAIIGGFVNAAQVTMYAAGGAHLSQHRAGNRGRRRHIGLDACGAILSPYAATWVLALRKSVVLHARRGGDAGGIPVIGPD